LSKKEVLNRENSCGKVFSSEKTAKKAVWRETGKTDAEFSTIRPQDLGVFSIGFPNWQGAKKPYGAKENGVFHIFRRHYCYYDYKYLSIRLLGSRLRESEEAREERGRRAVGITLSKSLSNY
jgi:hypothetical protein